MIRSKITFQRAAVWTLLVALVLYGLAIASTKAIVAMGPPLNGLPGLAGIIAAAGALFVALAIEMRFSNVSWGAALRNIGFKAGNRMQIVPAIAGAACILIGYAVIAGLLHKSTELETGFLFVSIKLLISQGLIEEAVFRGLIFRHLRKSRSFWRAATLSGVLFALIHVVNFAKGISPEILISVAISILFGFLLTFPLALLFEIGSGSLIAGAFLHLAVDSINCFKELGEPGAPMNTYLLFVLLAAFAVIVTAKGRSSKSNSGPA